MARSLSFALLLPMLAEPLNLPRVRKAFASHRWRKGGWGDCGRRLVHVPHVFQPGTTVVEYEQRIKHEAGASVEDKQLGTLPNDDSSNIAAAASAGASAGIGAAAAAAAASAISGVCVGGACQLGAGAVMGGAASSAGATGLASWAASAMIGLAGVGSFFNIPSSSAVFEQLESRSPPYEAVASHSRDRPAVLEIYSHRCPVCAKTGRYALSFLDKYKDVDWVMIDGEEPTNYMLVQDYEVDSIPHFVFISKDGEIQGEAVGNIPRDILRDNVEALSRGNPIPTSAFANCDNADEEIRRIRIHSILRQLEAVDKSFIDGVADI